MALEGEDTNVIEALDEESKSSSDDSGTPEQKTLRKYTGRTQPQPSVQSIRGHETGETGALPMSTYFPGMENNIQKGYYSGSVIGSNPIYAPSGLYPFGMIDAHRQALERAADQKVAEQDAWAKQMQAYTKFDPSKRDSINPQMYNKYISDLKDYREKFFKDNPGSTDKDLYNNEGFRSIVEKQGMAKQLEDHLVENTSKVLSERDKGRTLFGHDEATLNGFTNGSIHKNLLGFNGNDQDIALQEAGEVSRVKTYNPIEKSLDDLSTHIKPDDAKFFSGVSSQDGFKMVNTTTNEHTPAGRVKVAAMQSYNDNGYDEAYKNYQQYLQKGGRPVSNRPPSPEEYTAALVSRFGKKNETTSQIVKDEADKDNIDFDPNNLTTTGKVVTGMSKGNPVMKKDESGNETQVYHDKLDAQGKVIKNADGTAMQEPSFDEPKSYSFSTAPGGVTLTKPLKISLGEGAHWTDIGDSKGGNFDVQKTGGLKDLTIGDIHPFLVYSGTNKPVPQKRGDELIKNHPEEVEYKQFGIAKFNENGEDGKPKEKTALVSMDELENSINEKDKSKKMVLTMKAAAAAETDKIHQANGIQSVTTQSAYDALPKGSKYKDSNGTIATKK